MPAEVRHSPVAISGAVEPALVLVAINPIVFSFLAEEITSVSGFVDSRSLTLINAYEVMNRPIDLLLTLLDHECLGRKIFHPELP
ncbi:uncharacterized protein LOC123425177 isoform X5 [Hordeum vulgare subsp. vulgare]|uniref:uncharacterized protein LOC123425177 isoform X5 n=1 Tax=Hordeum vulgare subsp. vulgare TaxID=112509 RepID=UPI001D1A4CAC|nr:uncharacterized protein LOC123425177 isoform X5 [Hordeum vulgare subsp. vulgare]